MSKELSLKQLPDVVELLYPLQQWHQAELQPIDPPYQKKALDDDFAEAITQLGELVSPDLEKRWQEVQAELNGLREQTVSGWQPDVDGQSTPEQYWPTVVRQSEAQIQRYQAFEKISKVVDVLTALLIFFTTMVFSPDFTDPAQASLKWSMFALLTGTALFNHILRDEKRAYQRGDVADNLANTNKVYEIRNFIFAFNQKYGTQMPRNFYLASRFISALAKEKKQIQA